MSGRASSRTLLPAWTLARRELVRFIRQRNRVVGALAQPLLFWAIFGSGLNASFRPSTGAEGISYMEYFFPGTVVLILLLTAIFATISIIEDRNEGFMQSVLVSPVRPLGIVLGKLAGTSTLAVTQALLIFLLAPVVGLELSAKAVATAIPVLILIAVGLTALGFTIAWYSDSTQGFHAVMTAFLMPMWFLSGAFFPATGLPTWLGWIVTANPLTYGLGALRHVLYSADPATVAGLPSFATCLGVSAAFSLAAFAAALVAAHRPRTAIHGR